MRNESDERGAKLMTGSSWWKDATITTDVELLGEQGDAGVILRGSDEELGVDSYTGYYVGLRSNDGSLIVGLAEHGWLQLAGKAIPRRSASLPLVSIARHSCRLSHLRDRSGQRYRRGQLDQCQ